MTTLGPYIGGPKNQSFWNNSGQQQPIRTKFGTHRGDNVQFQKFQARSAQWWQNGGGLGRAPHSRNLFVSNRPIGLPHFRQLPNSWFSPNLATTRDPCPLETIRIDFRKFSLWGHPHITSSIYMPFWTPPPPSSSNVIRLQPPSPRWWRHHWRRSPFGNNGYFVLITPSKILIETTT